MATSRDISIPRNVLIVDSDQGVREAVATLLRAEGCTVTSAAGKERTAGTSREQKSQDFIALPPRARE